MLSLVLFESESVLYFRDFSDIDYHYERVGGMRIDTDR